MWFVLLYKVALTFEPVDKILWCDHSNECYSAVILSCGTVNIMPYLLSPWMPEDQSNESY